MTLLASGALALQDAGANSSTTAANSLESDTLTRGQDSYVDVRTFYELSGGDNFATLIEWKGNVGGYQSGTSVSTRWMSGSTLPILSQLIDPLPFSSGTRAGTPTFNSEPTSNLGTIGGQYYTDGGSNSRQIRAIIFGNPASSPSPNNTRHWVIFVLNGTSVPNTDNTFKSLKLTGSGTTYTFTRSSAHYSSSSNSCTAWAWEYNSTTSNNGIDSMYTSGTSGFEIMGPDITVSVNNGIAEEFGGADSSNVALSDYYRTPGGTLHNTTGIPTSGQIAFSDFLGKTKVDISTALTSGTMTSYYRAPAQYQPAYSGFVDSASHGTWSGSSFTYDGDTVEITVLRNFNGTMGITFKRTNGSAGTFNNSGWTNIRFYLNQTNNSGSPDLTLTRASGTFYTNSTQNYAQWSYTSAYSLTTYFGTTSSTSTFVEIE